MIGEAYAKVAIRVFDWFLPSKHQIRIKDGLISTTDELVINVKSLMTGIKNGDLSFNPKTIKLINHYLRQYKANRKKLR